MRKLTFACVLLAPALVLAQPKTALDWYNEGETQFSLSNFPAAIDAFKKGFAMEPVERNKAAYLYNIAQAYRLSKSDCNQAKFFYNRYLDLKSADTVKPLTPEKRTEVEGYLKDLEACAAAQDAASKKPPDSTSNDGKPKPDGKPDDGKKVAVGPDGKPIVDDDDNNNNGVTKSADQPPKLISARLIGGVAKFTTGDLAVPVQASGALIAGYPLSINPKLGIELGAAFTFSPVPFEDAMGTSKSATFIAAMANVGASYKVIPKVAIRADIGAGLLILNGISASPFTDFAETTGALSVFHLRAGISADIAITPNVIATIAPFAFSYSPAAENLREDITSITAIDVMVGLGYRM